MNRVIIYAREPKNALPQLQVEIGKEKTEEVYERNLYQLISQCASLSVLMITPDDVDYFKEHFPQVEVRNMPEKTFSQQLSTAIAQEVLEHQKVILLADDSPLIDLPTIDHAFMMLDEHDMVIGPSYNGKHYLVGFTNPKQVMGMKPSDDELEVYAKFKGEELEPHQSLRNAEDYNFFMESHLL